MFNFSVTSEVTTVSIVVSEVQAANFAEAEAKAAAAQGQDGADVSVEVVSIDRGEAATTFPPAFVPEATEGGYRPVRTQRVDV